MTWFEEVLHADLTGRGYMQRLEITRVVYRKKTDFQDLIIFDTPTFGRVLALDGIVQTTERDEFAYHEMMVHVPMLAHGGAREVLIIGGGDGGILREVLRHRVDRATMVEIDRTVVDLCVEHMPSLSAGAFDDPRTDLLITDGIRFVAETDRTFDVIIVDSTDPIGPGEVLFTEDFYAACKRRLNPGGVLVAQNGVPAFQPDELRTTTDRLSPLFADVGAYLTVVPTYVGGYMTLAWASDDAALRRVPLSTLEERFRAAAFPTRYYTPAVHAGAFALPPFIAELIA